MSTNTTTQRHILILGASYGALLAIKLLAAGHRVTLTCRTATAALINQEGIKVRLPIKGRADLLELPSTAFAAQLHATTPQLVGDLAAFDLVVLAMQEPQYRLPGIRELMRRIAQAGLPCMPIMNMPPLPYLHRLQALNPSLDIAACDSAYADPSVWADFEPGLMTLSSPDPQAFRPADEPVNVLQVALPTNFKAARFASDVHTALLRQLEADIEAVRYPVGDELLELPVKLKVSDSLFVPLAKWPMLLAGNYSCIQADTVRPIRDAVLGDRSASAAVYNWVGAVCQKLGASIEDLVPFDKYAAAANGLAKPSSSARALVAGATHIERVDLLVQQVAKQLGQSHPEVDQTVACVDAWIKKNRAAANSSQPVKICA
jgi:NAD(P)-dependent dehydrogenase (short-subunit alcohol dehydrogenase family)